MTSSASPLRHMSRSLLFKVAAAPIAAILGLLTARMVTQGLGLGAYGAYALIIGLAVVLPFTDLGLGASVLDVVSRRATLGRTAVIRVIAQSVRLLSVVGLLLSSALYFGSFLFEIDVLIGLGEVADADRALRNGLIVFFLSLPISVGPRMLIGLGYNHYAIAIQLLSPGVALLVVAGSLWLGMGLSIMVMGYFAGVALANGAACVMALVKLQIRVVEVVRLMVVRGKSEVLLRWVAGPMVLISASIAIANQSDRIIIGNLLGPASVAEYSIVYLIFGPLLGVLGSVGMVLWPYFVSLRESAQGVIGAVRVSQGASLAIALVMGAGLIIVAPTVGRYVGGADLSSVDPTLTAAFVVLLLLQSISVPLGMFLTDRRELAIMAVAHLVMMVGNVVLSILLTSVVGVSGPVWGTVLAIAVFILPVQIVRFGRVTA